MRKRILLILALIAVSFTSLRAQNVIDLIIAEALAVPDSTGVVDDYGRQGGWIEIFNTSQGTVNCAGCFLTDDRSNLKKSIIPKGDLRTKIGPRQTTLFYASGNGDDGTFYANFKVRPGSTVYLVSNDGRTVIDSLTIPANIPVGMSMRKEAHDLRQQEFKAVPTPTVPSPGIFNGDLNAASKAEAMAEKDPHGGILSSPSSRSRSCSAPSPSCGFCSGCSSTVPPRRRRPRRTSLRSPRRKRKARRPAWPKCLPALPPTRLRRSSPSPWIWNRAATTMPPSRWRCTSISPTPSTTTSPSS